VRPTRASRPRTGLHVRRLPAAPAPRLPCRGARAARRAPPRGGRRRAARSDGSGLLRAWVLLRRGEAGPGARPDLAGRRHAAHGALPGRPRRRRVGAARRRPRVAGARRPCRTARHRARRAVAVRRERAAVAPAAGRRGRPRRTAAEPAARGFAFPTSPARSASSSWRRVAVAACWRRSPSTPAATSPSARS
jgi:hypothetical protein